MEWVPGCGSRWTVDRSFQRHVDGPCDTYPGESISMVLLVKHSMGSGPMSGPGERHIYT